MSARAPLIGAGVAIAVLAGAYALMRGGDRTEISRDPPRDAAPHAAIDAAIDGAIDAAPVAPPPRPLPPVLEVTPDASPAAIDAAPIDAPALATGAAAFEQERRDAAWAPGMERTIERALARQAGARLQRVECRAQQCRLDYAGTEAELADTMAAFEGATGLRELAQTVTLALERGEDGSMQLHAYAAFAR